MEVLNVREYGTGSETKTIKDLFGEQLTLEKGVVLYFVNPVFSKPNEGFVMTAEGRVWTTTKGYAAPHEEIKELAQKAVKVIEEGKLGDLNLKFTL